MFNIITFWVMADHTPKTDSPLGFPRGLFYIIAHALINVNFIIKLLTIPTPRFYR